MDTLSASERLGALGHETRLSIFRLLVEAGADGLSAGAIGERLGLPAATLSFHLAHLARVGLISGRHESRFIYYSADFPTMDALIVFLADNCCEGKAGCLPGTARVSAAKFGPCTDEGNETATRAWPDGEPTPTRDDPTR